MEKLGFGWRKATKRYHYHEKNNHYSLCDSASYATTIYKKFIFLDESEMTPDMDICPTCYELRKEYVKGKIIKNFYNEKGQWDDSQVCPNCKTPVIFFNHKKTGEHLCTICNTMVSLA